MDGTIYLIGKDGKLEEMSQQPYEKEHILQKYLADYPNLLAGDQIDEAEPKRWLFISREVGVPKEEGASDTWSLDHLFLDQDGIPTLVEVKRSSDTRSRREVVAQMLDYAANAFVYWPIDRIRACFETSCDEQGIDPIERLREFLGAEDSQLIEDFWEKTKTNLQAEKIRLVFVADQIQPEMRKIGNVGDVGSKTTWRRVVIFKDVGDGSRSKGKRRLSDRLSDGRNAQDLFYSYSDNIIMPGWRIILCLFIRYEFNFFAKVFCSYPHVADGNTHANLAHPFKHKGC